MFYGDFDNFAMKEGSLFSWPGVQEVSFHDFCYKPLRKDGVSVTNQYFMVHVTRGNAHTESYYFQAKKGFQTAKPLGMAQFNGVARMAYQKSKPKWILFQPKDDGHFGAWIPPTKKTGSPDFPTLEITRKDNKSPTSETK